MVSGHGLPAHAGGAGAGAGADVEDGAAGEAADGVELVLGVVDAQAVDGEAAVGRAGGIGHILWVDQAHLISAGVVRLGHEAVAEAARGVADQVQAPLEALHAQDHAQGGRGDQLATGVGDDLAADLDRGGAEGDGGGDGHVAHHVRRWRWRRRRDDLLHRDGAGGLGGLAGGVGGDSAQGVGAVGHLAQGPGGAPGGAGAAADELVVGVQIDLGDAAGINGTDFDHGVGTQGGVLGRADEDHGGHAGGVGDADGLAHGAVAAAVAGAGRELVAALGQRDAGGEVAIGAGRDRAAGGLAINVDLDPRARRGGTGDAQLRGAELGTVGGAGDGGRRWSTQVEGERDVQRRLAAIAIGHDHAQGVAAVGQLGKVQELAGGNRAGVAVGLVEDGHTVDAALDAGDANGAFGRDGQHAGLGDGGVGGQRLTGEAQGDSGAGAAAGFLHGDLAAGGAHQTLGAGGARRERVAAIAHGGQGPGGLVGRGIEQGQALTIDKNFDVAHALRVDGRDGDAGVFGQHGASGGLVELHQGAGRRVADGLRQRKGVGAALGGAELHVEHFVARAGRQGEVRHRGRAFHAQPGFGGEAALLGDAVLGGLRAIELQLDSAHTGDVTGCGHHGAGEHGLGLQILAIVDAGADGVALPCGVADRISRAAGVAPPVALGIDDTGRLKVAHTVIGVAGNVGFANAGGGALLGLQTGGVGGEARLAEGGRASADDAHAQGVVQQLQLAEAVGAARQGQGRAAVEVAGQANGAAGVAQAEAVQGQSSGNDARGDDDAEPVAAFGGAGCCAQLATDLVVGLTGEYDVGGSDEAITHIEARTCAELDDDAVSDAELGGVGGVGRAGASKHGEGGHGGGRQQGTGASNPGASRAEQAMGRVHGFILYGLTVIAALVTGLKPGALAVMVVVPGATAVIVP